MPDDIVYFVHMTDTHIGPTTDYARHGHRSLPCARRMVKSINELPVVPDFVIHTGDVVTDPDPVSYQLAADTFARLNVPIYYVNGNHDTAIDIHRYLPMGPKLDVTADPSLLWYTFELKGYRFLVLDARGPDSIDPAGLLPEDQLEWLRRETRSDGPPLILFLHFPTLPMNSGWMDANMLILNGQSLHEALLPARTRLRAVFYGHVHQHMQTMRDGILYVATGSTFAQLSAWPGETTANVISDAPPAFSFVHLMPDQTIIHQHTFPRPQA